MINPRHDAEKLHGEFASAQPFPHIVVDDFFEAAVANDIVAELATCDLATWNRDDHSEQVNKRWMDDTDRLPPTTASALRFMNSEAACRFFSRLTGIEGLRPDPHYLGGGVHVSLRGGRLGVHADFNLHPDTGMHRRVNALVFLNQDWNPAWHGQLELWSDDASKPVVSVNPDFNRLVAFNITDHAFHGVPRPIECPPERMRFSLALYYYTSDRPQEEKAPFHWAAWQHAQTGMPRTELPEHLV
jgi:Rps23 Pro-64 3,4-dihydroxylase Tpa1-like proline 4-hydroxylase